MDICLHGCVVASYCGFNWKLFTNWSFHLIIGHYSIVFYEVSELSNHLKKWVICFVLIELNVLFIFWIQLCCLICALHVFSLPVSSLPFYSFNNVFWRLKLVTVIKSILLTFSFMVCAFCVIKNSCLPQGLKDFPLETIVSGFVFRSMIYLGLIFMYSVKLGWMFFSPASQNR